MSGSPDSIFNPALIGQRSYNKWKTPVEHLIQRWLNTDNIGTLVRCTFRYIVEYFEGYRDVRLEIALYDFGYTREELDELKAADKTARDVAQEIVSRTEEQGDNKD